MIEQLKQSNVETENRIVEQIESRNNDGISETVEKLTR
jgi:hypothetical protein